MKVRLLSRVRLFVTPRTVAYQVPPSMGFSRQEYLSGLPFPIPGDLPDPRIELGSFLVVQWLRVCAPDAQDLGSISGQGTRSHRLQLRVHMPVLKTPHASTKTWHSQISK